MKTFAKRFPGRQPNRGYLARCAECGEIVVHADCTNLPHHMHRYSDKCKRLANKRAANLKLPFGESS